LTELTPLTIDEILIKKHDVDNYSRRSVQDYATVVRTFLRYQGNIGQCHAGLADTIKAPRVYKYESLPSSPSWDDVKVLLKSTEGNHPRSIRDRAILMLLSIYGLRCSEVVKLRLDDIDWKNELLHLQRAKTSRPQTFPLIFSVGNAILRYITEIRPNNCSLREVFLCMRSPYRPLSNSGMYQIVSLRIKPLGLAIKHHGPHALRHACATRLINEGVTLKEISDHLGHQGLETTRTYTKVDLNSLRQIADFDIGDLL
jgi:integrase/recombinase XerD